MTLEDIQKMMRDSKEIIGEEAQINAVKEDSENILYCYDPSYKVLKESVDKKEATEVEHLIYLPEIPEELALIIVEDYGGYVSFLKNPSEKVLIEAVKHESDVIGYITHPSLAIQMAAISEHWTAISYIDFPSEEVQIHLLNWLKQQSLEDLGVKDFNKVFEFFNNPCVSIKKAFGKENDISRDYKVDRLKEINKTNIIKHIKKHGFYENDPENTINSTWLNNEYMQDEDIQLEMVKSNPYNIKYFCTLPYVSLKVMEAALKANPEVIEYFKLGWIDPNAYGNVNVDDFLKELGLG